MYNRIIRNDISKSKVITIIITLFIAAAAMLVSLAVILTVNLSGAVNTLMEQAKAIHFMQMHSGELDREELAYFAQQNEYVDEFQVIEFLNIDGAQMLFPTTSLAGNMQDNGLCIQSEKFDYLLDMDGNVIHAKERELYIPMCYLRENIAKVGDNAMICGRQFTVAGFLRDSQMNSSLSSSKRFLVHKKDFAALQKCGKPEYLIEFRLNKLDSLGVFETAYMSAGLPANGPTITYGLLKTLNSFSDGMMIGVILLVSLLVVTIAFLCIRFTLLAKLEEDFREIGVMKAIGLQISEIKRIYLAKYAVIGFIGCFIGYMCALALKEPLTASIRRYMGESTKATLAAGLGILGVLLVFLCIIAFVNLILRRLTHVSAVEAIRFGLRQEKAGKRTGFSLRKNGMLSANIFLAIQDINIRKKIYITMLLVQIIAAFIMIVPQNLYNTIAAKDFGTYMGIGNCDLRIDVQQAQNIEQKSNEISSVIEHDMEIEKAVVLTTKIFQTNTGENVKVELGDHLIFPVAYAVGKAPTTDREIALSQMNAEEFGKRVGDSMILMTGQGERFFTVCGIYSDITNGGKTAKAAFKDSSNDALWSIIYANVASGVTVAERVTAYKILFPEMKIAAIDSYIGETFGQTIHAVQIVSYVAFAIAAGTVLLITLLFLKMLIAKDGYAIAVMKAIGFTSKDIRWQYAIRGYIILFMGIVLGTVLANTAGEELGKMVISAFGASSFRFTVNKVASYLFCPLGMVCALFFGAALGTSTAGKMKLSEHIKE